MAGSKLSTESPTINRCRTCPMDDENPFGTGSHRDKFPRERHNSTLSSSARQERKIMFTCGYNYMTVAFQFNVGDILWGKW